MNMVVCWLNQGAMLARAYVIKTVIATFLETKNIIGQIS